MSDASLAADLVLTDLDDADALTRFLARHALGPVRRMWHMPEPSPDEGDLAPRMASSGDDSPAHFGPIISSLVIWASLFPHAVQLFADLETIRQSPHTAWLDGGFSFAVWTGYARVRQQVGGLFGPPSTIADDERRANVLFRHEPRRNDVALDSCARSRDCCCGCTGPRKSGPTTSSATRPGSSTWTSLRPASSTTSCAAMPIAG